MTAQHSGEGETPPYTLDVSLPVAKYLERNSDWRNEANCRGNEGTIFFALRSVKHQEEAISMCTVCEVRLQCLNFAIRNEEKNGIWGGVNFRRINEATRKELLSAVSNL
jgi:WhiB family redox-sensing transcriptional regulator